MDKNNIVFGVSGLIIGLLLGILAGGKMAVGNAPATQVVQQASAPMANPGQLNARIAEAEKIVAKDPKNVQAWITLGNDYFDANNPQKSVQAYEKALELQPDNPNVLTDQGVMFRALGFYDRAIANFEKASKIDQNHIQSLFNLGIVYAVDLKQPAKARSAWEKLLARDQASEMARQTKEMLNQLPK